MTSAFTKKFHINFNFEYYLFLLFSCPEFIFPPSSAVARRFMCNCLCVLCVWLLFIFFSAAEKVCSHQHIYIYTLWFIPTLLLVTTTTTARHTARRGHGHQLLYKNVVSPFFLLFLSEMLTMTSFATCFSSTRLALFTSRSLTSSRKSC
jgi:hypothetical protein